MNNYGSRRSLLEFEQLLLPVALLRITSSSGHSPDFDALLADICNTRDRQFNPYEVDYCRVSEDFSLNTTTVQPSFQVSCDILFLRWILGVCKQEKSAECGLVNWHEYLVSDTSYKGEKDVYFQSNLSYRKEIKGACMAVAGILQSEHLQVALSQIMIETGMLRQRNWRFKITDLV
ncbi:hypothetical protein GG344DRAFT_64086 [Lentinula edodes]|nr:hypothetical protein GG344DRAFT_64086 [Lentinula edodes]